MINSVYFFCCPMGAPDNTGYEHQIISIAEGLKELGIKFYSNINYWQESITTGYKYLLSNLGNVRYQDCDVVVFSSNYVDFKGYKDLSEELFKPGRKYKLVFLDHADGLLTPGFDIKENVDLVLKSHFSNKYNFPSNFRPWQFGLTNRVIKAVNYSHSEKRTNDVLVNFRVHHSTREEAQNVVLPIMYKYLTVNTETDALAENESEADKLHWHQTGRRHYSSYYKRLSESTACACFGGYFQKSLPFQGNKLGFYLRHLDYKFKLFRNDKVYQFDSWRFWESLAAGCCTIHIDLKRYGAVLPDMPVNGVHYLGVDFDNPSKFEKELAKGTEFLREVGEQGRKWALENYSPKATASRFLELLT